VGQARDATGVALGLAAPTVLSASTVGSLVTFANGTVADADAVNANFAALRDAVDDNAAKITATATADAHFDPQGFLTNGSGPLRLDEWNSQLIADGGNNAAHGNASGLGVLEGAFTVSAELSYSWGWGCFGVAAAEDFHEARLLKPRVDSQQMVTFAAEVCNNNSNNLWRVYGWAGVAGDAGTTVHSEGGKSGGTHRFVRDGSDQIFAVEPDGTQHLVGTYAGPMKVTGDVQSPSWVRITGVTYP
jgi:hypothetical protein